MASASALAAIALCSNTVKSYCFFVADGFFLIMWFIIAVIFGSMYFPFSKQELLVDKGTTGPGLAAMRTVAILSLVVLVAWICTFGMAIWHFIRVKGAMKSGRLT